jgi:hypothetical protein
MTVSAPSAFTTVTIEGTAPLTASTGTLTDGTWTGSASSVTFTATGTTRITKITVATSQQTASATSVADLLALSDSDNANLYLADSANARVVDVIDGDLFIRDNTGAICLRGFTGLPTTAFNQHVAGYLKGQRTTVDGLPVFQAVSGSDTKRFLVANPVTEADVEPLSVSVDELKNHPADWVAVSSLSIPLDASASVSPSLVIANKHNLGESDAYYEPYAGSVVDLHAVVYTVGDSVTLVPVSHQVTADSIHTFTYTTEPSYPAERFVVSRQLGFTAPATNLTNASVRLDIDSEADKWQIITLPVGQLEGFDYYTLSKVQDGVAHFAPATTVEPGTPYLVKALGHVSDSILNGTLLSAAAAQTVTVDDAKLVGTYTAATLPADGTALVVSADGTSTEAATTAPALSGWLSVVAGTRLAIAIDDPKTGISLPTSTTDDAQPVYNLSGQRVDNHYKGIIIKNGKKTINR